MSVNVATGEQLEKFKIFDVKDVSQLAPGLQLTNTTGRNNTTTLRGVTFDPDQGTAPAVQLYLNEIPADAQTAFTAMYDVQQIEVLRGPQGLLRGLSAPAGSITIATRKPNFDKIEGYMQATGTDRHAYNVQGGVSLPFSDSFAIRVAGLVDGNRLNQVRDVNLGGQHSQSRTESGRITLGWKPSSDFTAYLNYQYLHADNRQFQQVIGSGNTPFGTYRSVFGIPSVFMPPAFGGGPFATDTSVVSGPALGVSDYGAVQEGAFRNQNETHIVNLQFDYDLGPATLSFVGAHQFSKLKINRDLDAANAIPNYIQTSNVVTPYKVDTAELRLTSDNEEGLGWGVGAFYSKQTGTTVVNQDNSIFQYAVAPNALVNPPCGLVGGAAAGCTGNFAPYTLPNQLPLSVLVTVPVDSETWSFNGNLRYKTGPLTIQGGLRYSIMRKVQTTQQSLSGIFNTPPAEIIPAALQRTRNTPITGGATINYAFSPDLNAYIAYGHSFRQGSTKVAGPAVVSDDLIRTNPEKTDSFEFGLKGSLIDRKLNYTVAAFYQKLDGFLSRFTNIYWSSPTNPGQTTGGFDFNYNGDAKVKGIEASLDARPTRDWDLSISAAYTHARWSNALLPCNDYAGTGTPNTTGTPAVTGTGNVSYCNSSDKLANTPDFSLNANTELRFPMDKVTPFVRALMTYTPSYNWWQSQYRFKDREMVNLFLGVRSNDDKWELDLFAKNLLNQKRITNISLGEVTTNASVYGTYDSGYSSVNVTNPREFGATLNFKW
ncbi:TonB-dependent receptor [Sphingobium sp. CAP-1]|uniref:TonB-dependent receptor n=1 Tax=Sphingobium sp. CAP-1 TaxID=2676077 RepID=UPI0018AD1AA4|nr:TonB-dependent receptor [Sphingobium sp. CAP-1]